MKVFWIIVGIINLIGWFIAAFNGEDYQNFMIQTLFSCVLVGICSIEEKLDKIN